MVIYGYIAFSCLFVFIGAEEPFCGNKCYGNGLSITFKNCYCDTSCVNTFNDCCGDYEHASTQRIQHPRNISCTSVSEEAFTMLVNSCPENWRGPDFIKNSCNARSNNLDPIGATPITNSISGITYSSFYCAICNNDAESMIFWTLKVVCPTLDSNLVLDSQEALNYIFYNKQRRQWGFLMRQDDTAVESFHGCQIKVTPPDQVSTKVRECQPEISECLPSWKQDFIREKCGSYSDPVYANQTRFKNFYCAICNKIDQSKLSCGTAVGPRYDHVPDHTGMPNFALLLDVNLSDGEHVGTRSAPPSCASGEKYDPFKKSCRNIVCGIPGYHVVNGKCEKN